MICCCGKLLQCRKRLYVQLPKVEFDTLILDSEFGGDWRAALTNKVAHWQGGINNVNKLAKLCNFSPKQRCNIFIKIRQLSRNMICYDWNIVKKETSVQDTYIDGLVPRPAIANLITSCIELVDTSLVFTVRYLSKALILQ